MSEEKKDVKPEQAAAAENKAEQGGADDRRPRRGGGGRGPRQGGGPRRGREREEKEFEQRTLALDRVTRVTKGGKRMRFRAAMIIGDVKTHRVALGVAKANDVSNAMNKAVSQAKKRVMTVPLKDETIPHDVSYKYRAAKILLKPAPKGTGVKAGGAVRVVLELAGVPNVTAKILGSKNKLNNAKATLAALAKLRPYKAE